MNELTVVEGGAAMAAPHSRHPAEAGQFRIIPNRFIPQQPLKPDGER
jgi:hypothetical protein